MKIKEQFIIIPEEAWIKGIENKDYLACYCFIREHALMTNKVIFTKKVLYDQLRVKRQNIKERVCQAMQQVLNDFCDDDAKIDFKKFKVNELICVFLDEEKLDRKGKSFAKIYADDLIKLESYATSQQNYQDMLLLLCYYRTRMIKRNTDSTVEIAPAILYKYLLDISTELQLPLSATVRCLDILQEVKIINLYRMNTKKINDNYFTGKLIIYDYVNRDELYSNEEILDAAIKYVNKKSKDQ